jgi:hypothetical protein
MDWKIPATILILAFIVGLGILPLFSSDFSSQVTNPLTSVGDIFGGISQKTPQYEENVHFSMSASDFPTIRTASPVTILVSSNQKYGLILDGKNMSVKGKLSIQNFTGDIDLKAGKLSGSASLIASDNFDLEGKTNLQLENSGLDEIAVSDLMIGEFMAKSGILTTTIVQGKASEMRIPLGSDGAKVDGFKGNVSYANNTFYIEGTSSVITATGLTLGIAQLK